MRVFLRKKFLLLREAKIPPSPALQKGRVSFFKNRWLSLSKPGKLRGIYFFQFPKTRRLGKIIIIGLYLLLLSSETFAQFSIEHAQTHLVDNVYLLNANLNYGLTDVAIEAMQNGVPLTLVLTIKLEQIRQYFWDKEITTLKQRYELQYYALRRQYVLKYLNTGIQEIFSSLHDALTRLGSLTEFPLIDQYLIKYNTVNYRVYLQTHLDIESLPVPLRPIAYLSSQWRLSSNWYLCPLQP
jgi:hypothetical protein